MHPPKSSKVWLFQISSKNYEPSSLNLCTNTCRCLWLPIYSTFSKGTGLAKGLIIWDWSVFWKFKVINCSQKCALPSLRRFWSFRYFIFHLKTMKHNRKRTFTSCFKVLREFLKHWRMFQNWLLRTGVFGNVSKQWSRKWNTVCSG